MFADREFAGEALAELREARDRLGDPVFAYCLMPDHVHLVIGVEQTPLPRFIQAFKSRTFQRWFRRQARETFWQRGFYEHALRQGVDLRATVDYVLHNPVRAGLVSEWDDYEWAGSLEWSL